MITVIPNPTITTQEIPITMTMIHIMPLTIFIQNFTDYFIGEIIIQDILSEAIPILIL